MKVHKKIVSKNTPYERTIWYNKNELCHREDGPAVMYKSKQKEWWKEWWLDGTRYSEEDYNHEMYKRNLNKLNEST